MAARRPTITIRRATDDDAEALRATFAQPRAMEGTLQLPYPTAEMWRKRIGDIGADDYLLVAEVRGEVVGNLGPATFGQDHNALLLVDASGTRALPHADKLTLARQLIAEISSRLNA